MSRETPEQWQKAMAAAGIPSFRRLAEAAGVHTSTITAMVYGDRETSPDTVAKVADVLRMDVVTMSRWVGQARTVAAPYVPPAEAHLLTSRQRKAVDEIIRAMTDREEASHGAPTNRPDLVTTDEDGNVTSIVEVKSTTRRPKPPTMEEIESGQAAAHKTRRKKADRHP